MLVLGDTTVRKIVDLDPFALPLDLLIPGADLDALGDDIACLTEDHIDRAAGTVLLGVHSLVVRSGPLTILIDTCVGEHKERPVRADWHRRDGGPYLPALAAAGLEPADIDIVLCTHLHADHVGWNTRLENGRWVPTFPNARYLIGRTELRHWQDAERTRPGAANHSSYADSVLPILEAGLCEEVDDGFALAPGMTIVPLAGHSPGQVGLELAVAPGRRALFCGDAFHSPLQVLRPDWSSRFCFDRKAAADLRFELCARSADDGMLLVPAHLRGSMAMRAIRKRDGFRPEFV
tara:strand:+ start:10377 stop:11252 length:876 start_codon:yes stop_codon:yes gene_type:complete